MRTHRIAAATGALYVVAAVVGNVLTTGSGQDGQSGAAVLADLRAGRSPAQSIGMVLGVLSFAAFLAFLGHLHRTLRRPGPAGERAATTALGAALVMVAVEIGSAAPHLAALADRNALSPDLARLLTDLNSAGFVISGYVYGIFIAAAGLSAFASRALPRGLAIAGMAVGVLTVVSAVAGVLDLAAYVPIPYLLCLAWVLVVSVVLAVRHPRPAEPTTDRAASAVPAEATTTA
jgi:hypothetical protein